MRPRRSWLLHVLEILWDYILVLGFWRVDSEGPARIVGNSGKSREVSRKSWISIIQAGADPCERRFFSQRFFGELTRRVLGRPGWSWGGLHTPGHIKDPVEVVVALWTTRLLLTQQHLLITWSGHKVLWTKTWRFSHAFWESQLGGSWQDCREFWKVVGGFLDILDPYHASRGEPMWARRGFFSHKSLDYGFQKDLGASEPNEENQ